MAKVRIKDTNHIPDVIRDIKKLNEMTVEAGVFGADDQHLLMLATVHEFGAVIKAKKKFLAIPTENAGDKRPKDFSDLVFVPAPEGRKAFLIQKRRGRPGDGVIMFILVPSVKIPERSFIRSTMDEQQAEWAKFGGQRLGLVIERKLDPDTMVRQIGEKVKDGIQQRMLHMEPPNSPITVRRKKSDKPLIDGGRLRQAVTFKVVQR